MEKPGYIEKFKKAKKKRRQRIHVQASEGRCVLEGVGGSKGVDRAGWLG